MALVRVNEQGRRIGERHPAAVLSDAEVEQLLADREAGLSLAALARKARVDAVIDLRDKLDRGDVWASDYQALLGRVERSAA